MRHTQQRAAAHLGGMLTGCVMLAILFLSENLVRAWSTAPVADLDALNLTQSVRITDREGNDLYRFFDEEDRSNLRFDQLPDVLKDAFLAIEDRRFFERSACVDIQAIGRALLVNATTDRVEGASTITQQLARNLFLTREKTLDRKIKEVRIACMLEQTVSREDILAAYLNQVAYVGSVFGVERAAQMFFGISAKDVSLPQAAVLAAIPQRNGYFNPYGIHRRTAITHQAIRRLRAGSMRAEELQSEDVRIGLLSRVVQTPSGSVRIKGRAEMVLEAMVEERMITQEEYERASLALIHLVFQPMQRTIAASHFTLRIRDELRSLIRYVDNSAAWLSDGIVIQTTIDPLIQHGVENIANEAIANIRDVGGQDLAIVVLDRHTRQILGYVGNVGNSPTDQIDMAATPRQPGSSFKPIVYAAYLEKGFTPDSLIADSPLTIGGDTPRNYDSGFKGNMSVRNALAQSRNIPAIRAFEAAGGENVILGIARMLGARWPELYKQAQKESFRYGWPMAIGSAEVPLVEMVQAYASIAEGGVYKSMRDICAIQSHNRLLPLPPEEIIQAISEDSAAGIRSILEDENSRPQGYWRSILTIDNMKTGAKTGTSNLCLARDARGSCRSYAVSNIWTIGFGPNTVVGVWAGNADGTSFRDEKVDGITHAAPIWNKVVQLAEKNYRGGVRCQ